MATQKFPLELVPRYNIAPSQEVLAVASDWAHNQGQLMRWGLVPYDPKQMKAYEVSKLVNSPRNYGPEVIATLEMEASQQGFP